MPRRARRIPIFALLIAACGSPGADRSGSEPDILPSVDLVGLDGDTVRLTEQRGKALLVNFWASWCAPCRGELPALAAYYRTLDTARVAFVGISVDDTREAAVEFIASFDAPYPWFHAGPPIQGVFGFIGLPYTLIVDPHGRIVTEIYGFGSVAEWERLQRTLEAHMPDVPPVRDSASATPARDSATASRAPDPALPTALGAS